MSTATNARDGFIPTRHSLLTRLKHWDDQEGWSEFFDTYWQLIYGVARKAGLGEADAQEVVQETVISVAKRMKDFKTGREHGSFKAWLLTIVRRRIADQLRKRPPVDRANIHRSPDDTARTGTVDRIPDPNAPQLEDFLEQEWEANRISVALEHLKRKTGAKQFQIFQLLVIREMEVSEVAKVLGVSRTLVYVTKHRLGKLFKRELERFDAKPD